MERDAFFGCGSCHREQPPRGQFSTVHGGYEPVLSGTPLNGDGAHPNQQDMFAHCEGDAASSEDDLSQASPLPQRRPWEQMSPAAKQPGLPVTQDWMVNALHRERQEMLGAFEHALARSERQLEYSIIGRVEQLLTGGALTNGVNGGLNGTINGGVKGFSGSNGMNGNGLHGGLSTDTLSTMASAGMPSNAYQSPMPPTLGQDANGCIVSDAWSRPRPPLLNGDAMSHNGGLYAMPPTAPAPTVYGQVDQDQVKLLEPLQEEYALTAPADWKPQLSGERTENPHTRKRLSVFPDHSEIPQEKVPEEGGVFSDIRAMKEQLRKNVSQKQYCVMDYYKTSGFFQLVARSHVFEHMTHVVIASNALWIAVDTDLNGADSLLEAKSIFVVAENLFCVYFTLEVIIRFMAFADKFNCLKDGWFCFDSFLVTVMIGETWILTSVTYILGGNGSMGEASLLKLVRLLRLTRMLRMARLLRAMPELMIMIKGMSVAMRSVFFTLCLLIAIVYVFAVTLTQLCSDSPMGEIYFPTVITAMNTLFLHGTLPDFAGIVEDIGEAGIGYRIIMLGYILLTGLVVMNMLVGVLVEAVSVVAAVEKEALLVNWVKSRLQALYTTIDIDGDGLIGRQEFESLLSSVPAARALQEVGVDVVGLVDFTDLIFTDDRTIDFQELMEIMLSLRGSNTATVKDIVDLRKLLLTEIGQLANGGAADGGNNLGAQCFGTSTKTRQFP